jgi:hypothetical protein
MGKGTDAACTFLCSPVLACMHSCACMHMRTACSPVGAPKRLWHRESAGRAGQSALVRWGARCRGEIHRPACALCRLACSGTPWPGRTRSTPARQPTTAGWPAGWCADRRTCMTASGGPPPLAVKICRPDSWCSALARACCGSCWPRICCLSPNGAVCRPLEAAMNPRLRYYSTREHPLWKYFTVYYCKTADRPN